LNLKGGGERLASTILSSSKAIKGSGKLLLPEVDKHVLKKELVIN
jgi:hypothetical protein